MVIEDEEHNFNLFRECLSGALVENIAAKKPKLKKKAAKGQDSRSTGEVLEKKQQMHGNAGVAIWRRIEVERSIKSNIAEGA